MRLGVSVTTVLFVATILMIILANSSTPIQALARLLVNHTVAVTGISTNFTSSTMPTPIKISSLTHSQLDNFSYSD
jgi:hypothetical protein